VADEEVLEEQMLLGGISIDLFLPARKLVIETDGPNHFFQNQEPTGSTKFKRRILEKYGYRVCPVLYSSFRMMGGKEQREMLIELLRPQGEPMLPATTSVVIGRTVITADPSGRSLITLKPHPLGARRRNSQH
jgi:hypothetical protein